MTDTIIISGSRIRIASAFTEAATPFAASAVALVVVAPGAAKVSYSMGSLTNPSTGVFYVEIVPTAIGQWAYLWSSTASGEETYYKGTFQVVSVDPIFL